MQDLEIREFSQAIVNFTNKSMLPLEVKRLALADILHQIDMAANDAIQAELIERSRIEHEEQDKKKEEVDEHGDTEQTV